MGKEHFKVKDLHYTKTWNNFPVVPWQFLLDHLGTRKLPCLTWRRRWWRKQGICSRIRKKMVFSISPLFLYKTVAHNACPPTCKPYKDPVLINHFLSITLLLIEFFLCWETERIGALEPAKSHLVVSLGNTRETTNDSQLLQGGRLFWLAHNIPFLTLPTYTEISLLSVPVSLLCVGLECSSPGFLEHDPSFGLQEQIPALCVLL